ncbi:MAG TPA: PQQ-binding-like beta-propeller repeat protein [Methanoregulaceae archaeon]|nr:PQQ-binding-like beta-propeller repeat protein [Methanoregulaceae archaeon]HPD76290.1 PQQ-binding-like beta-propeller repeat protein [Methanoregulaceae archaeon]
MDCPVSMTLPSHRFILAVFIVMITLCGCASASTPAWTIEKKVSAIYPSYDGKTIVASGNNLLYMANDGTIAWMDKPYDYIDVAGDGEYVIAAGPYATLYDRKGNKVWENENTGDSASNDEPLKVKISRDGNLILTYTSVKFHTWSISGGLVGANTSYLVTEGNAYFSDVAMSPSGDEILFFTVSGIYAVNRTGAPISKNEDDWECRIGTLADDGRKAVCAYDNRLAYGHTSGVQLWDKRIASDSITSIAVSSGTDPRIVAGSLDGYVYVVDATGDVLWNQKLFTYRVDQPITVSITRDGNTICARSLDTKTMKGAIFLFDRNGNQIFSTEEEDAVGTLSPDGSLLLIGTEDDLSAYALATLTSAPLAAGETETVPATAAETTIAAAASVSPAASAVTGTVAATAVPPTTPPAPVLPALALVACVIVAAIVVRQ